MTINRAENEALALFHEEESKRYYATAARNGGATGDAARSYGSMHAQKAREYRAANSIAPNVSHLNLRLIAWTGKGIRITHIATGREAANAYMLAHEDEGLIATAGDPEAGGLCFIARDDDLGT